MRLTRQALRCGPMLIGTLTCSVFAYCRISSIPNIAKLTDSSPVIVVGEVLRVVQVGNGAVPMPDGKPYTCASMSAFIRVDEVLKGKMAYSTIEVDYLQNSDWESGPLTNVLREGTYLMFFLKETDGKKFAFAAPEQSSMPMSRSRGALSGSSDGDLYTKVLRYLGEGLFDEQASSQDRTRTIFVIDSEQSPAVPKMFKEAFDSPAAKSDRAFRFELLAALVRHKDVSVLPDLETALLTNHDVALDIARGNLIYALQQVDTSLSGPILIQALKLPESRLRVAAAAALGSVLSNDAIKALFGALDDPDPEVRGSAINSLTGIFHAPQCLPTGYAPAALFEACVEHWKVFAATQNLPLTK
jgi:hypothetical protein